MSAADDENEEVQPADTSNPFAGKLVRSGLDAHKHNPEDPQWHLADSFHPYAPFPGNAIKWESYVYDDGTTYEGLMKEDIPHGKGVLTFGLGSDGSGGGGGGIQNAGVGDRYEGEFHSGFASGLGMYTSRSGEVYRGEWRHGLKHGCGAVHDFSAFYKAVEDGQDPQKAWKKLAKQISDKATYGTWQGDRFAAVASDYVVNSCHIHEVRGVLEEMESVLTKARMFAHKPDGEVTWMALRDAQGNPAPVMQDPMHYPHGTGFLAPGPMGQCHPLPDNEQLKEEMRLHARNHARIFNMYNFDYDPSPKSDLVKAWKLFAKKVAKDTVLKEELAEVEARMARQENREREARVARRKGRRQEAVEEERPEPAQQAAEDGEDEDGGPIDESDLLASTDGVQVPSQQQQHEAGSLSPSTSSSSNSSQQGSWWHGGPTIFASASMRRSGVCRMNPAARAVYNTFRRAAEHAPRRRSLTRPQRRPATSSQ